MGEIIATFKSSGKIPVEIEWLKIAANDGAIMSAESLNSFNGILLCPAAPQIRLAETRQPPVATNLIIYNITRLNSLINTLKYHLLVYAIRLLFHPWSDLKNHLKLLSDKSY